MLKKRIPLAVVIDFDGTVTELDVVDGLLARFARDDRWLEWERRWRDGRIGSAECLRNQLESVRVSHRELAVYLKDIRLDPGFHDLRAALDERGVPLFVLSDGFDLFIRTIFKNHKVGGVPFRSNRLKLKGRRLVPSFPRQSGSCGRCGHCKRVFFEQHRGKAGHFVFIGDGRSDICAMGVADTVYAKNGLARYCARSGRPYTAFRSLGDVARDLSGMIDEGTVFQRGGVSESIGV